MNQKTRHIMIRIALAILAGLAILPAMASAESHVTLTGAGATFPYPIYSKWFDMYHDKTGVKINYSRSGRAAGSSRSAWAPSTSARATPRCRTSGSKTCLAP
jgi:ABC-type phosphate transport system substrate-binding protein